jgi:hypothetical protein
MNTLWRRILERHTAARQRIRARAPLVYVRRTDPQSPSRPRQAARRQSAPAAAPWNIHVHLTWPLFSMRTPESTPGASDRTVVRQTLRPSVSLWRSVLDRVERAWSGGRTVTHVVESAQKAGPRAPSTELTTIRLTSAASASPASRPSRQEATVSARRAQGETFHRAAHNSPTLERGVTTRTAIKAPIEMRAPGAVTEGQPFAVRLRKRHMLWRESLSGDSRARGRENAPPAVVVAGRGVASAALRESARAGSPPAPVMTTLTRTHLRESTPGALMAAADRPPLYANQVPRNFAAHPQQAPAAPAVVAPPVMPPSPPAPPPIDVARLSEDVYHHLQRRIRIERERRGL